MYVQKTKDDRSIQGFTGNALEKIHILYLIFKLFASKYI